MSTGEMATIDLKGVNSYADHEYFTSDPMKQYVEEQASIGGYSSASEYVCELVRADQKRRGKDQLEKLLIQSLQSGEPIDVTPEMLDDVRKRLRSRANGRKPAKL